MSIAQLNYGGACARQLLSPLADAVAAAEVARMFGELRPVEQTAALLLTTRGAVNAYADAESIRLVALVP